MRPSWTSALVSTMLALGTTLAAEEVRATQPLYRIKVLPADSGIRPFFPSAINQQGEVAGIGVHTDTRDDVGIRYRQGVVTELPDSPHPDIYDINAGGDILGQIFIEHKVYVWHPDGQRELIPANFVATGINAAGQLTGTSGTGTWRAVLWDAGKLTDLGDLGGGESQATKINDAGHVTGVSWTGQGSASHAFIWRDGVMQDLGVLPGSGGWYSGGLAINALDHVAGTANNSNGNVMAFLYDGTTMRRLPKLDTGEEFEPNALNIHDEVVGSTNTNKAVLYRHGHTYALQTLLDDSGAGWERLEAAYGINDKGQIVGTGRRDGRLRAFIATPVTR